MIFPFYILIFSTHIAHFKHILHKVRGNYVLQVSPSRLDSQLPATAPAYHPVDPTGQISACGTIAPHSSAVRNIRIRKGINLDLWH